MYVGNKNMIKLIDFKIIMEKLMLSFFIIIK